MIVTREPRLPGLPRIDFLRHPMLRAAGVVLGVLRLDLLHPLWGGNKYFKLWPNLQSARERGLGTIVSFGGAYSNHLHALAALGRASAIATIGIVRGEQPVRPSPMLCDARAWGMQLRFVSRADYRQRRDPRWVAGLMRDLPPAWLVPEGGDNTAGFTGCRALGAAIRARYGTEWEVLATACGTGTTLAGLVAAGAGQVLGIAAVRDAAGIEQRVAAHLAGTVVAAGAGFRVLERFAGRGFARLDASHRALMEDFRVNHGMPLDPVYTVKLFHGLLQLAAEGYFAPGTRVLALHSGGLQGARAMAPATVCRS